VYRLSGERDELLATKDRLERELATARAGSAGIESFQSTMKSRLDELHAVVEASTALGLFRRPPAPGSASPTTVVVAAGKAKGPGTSELAALLDSPELTGRRARERRVSERDSVQRMKKANQGLGGAEVECRKDRSGKIVCLSNGEQRVGVVKKDIVFEDMHASLAPAIVNADNPQRSREQQWSGDQRELIERASRYAAILRALPIGSPVSGELTSGFGYRLSPFSHHSSFHEGVDLSLDSGGKVLAPGDGVVIKSEYDGTYGWMIDIAHTPELVTRYAHLTKSSVRSGQKVRRGQQIALSGSTGRSTGPHLHYEVRYRGRPRNPMPFIALAEKLATVSSVAFTEPTSAESTLKG
jgi:murein DD-endopeptidase MepM/ murein hydrolase activator NlpD